MSDAGEIVVPLSPMEERFERFRAAAGFVMAPLAFAGVWLTSMPALDGVDGGVSPAHRLAAVLAAVIVLWVTEAIPMPVTALAGAAACVVLGVADAKTVFRPFSEPLIFLFIGSFILARAIFLHRLDKRLAFAALSWRWIDGRPSRILLVFGATSCVLSGWMSNTATTAMMFAIGLSMLSFMFASEADGGPKIDRRYATGMMLMTSFSASIGGLATPVGSPPNLIGLGFIKEAIGQDVTFFAWSAIGVPIVFSLFVILYLYLNKLCPAGIRQLPDTQALVRREHERLGPWTPGQISTLIAFILTAVLWVVPGLFALILGSDAPAYTWLNSHFPEAVAALIGAILLFLLPGGEHRRAITWTEAAQIDWGIVFLYGGGVALGTLATDLGLAKVVGTSLANSLGEHLDFVRHPWLLVAMATIVATLVSESTSNTASATVVVPVAISVAKAAGVDPLAPALGATFGASLGFMLPVSTPCNAIVYGSGYVPLGRMIRYGVLLDIAGMIVVIVLVTWLTPYIFTAR